MAQWVGWLTRHPTSPNVAMARAVASSSGCPGCDAPASLSSAAQQAASSPKLLVMGGLELPAARRCDAAGASWGTARRVAGGAMPPVAGGQQSVATGNRWFRAARCQTVRCRWCVVGHGPNLPPFLPRPRSTLSTPTSSSSSSPRLLPCQTPICWLSYLLLLFDYPVFLLHWSL